ncbi:arsenite methyltransferase isoform X2 [Hoplias malabaricus]|uniref:arsenite methyltransferase isoform X2 n=1 Tax=Hoplias malabaricus TaxID=27720 RepID=UPI003462702A
MADTTTPSRKEVGAETHDHVKDYYGKVLKKTSDLKSNACVPCDRPTPPYIKEALGEIHPDVTARYFGCGLVVPECVEGCRLLDLGCGSGRDCYMLSKLVGENGHVTGVDMTENQLEVARKYIDYHMQRFGYKKPNVNFVHGFIEALSEAGLEEESYDIVISNCVLNLSPDKTSVLRETYNVLKDGGELYFSDVYSSSRISESLRSNKVLWGECLSGALWWQDFIGLAEEVGFCTPRLVTASVVSVGNAELEKLLGDYKFVSATYRLFKLPKNSERKPSLVIYNGNITGSEEDLEFDAQYAFKVNEVLVVDGDMSSILKNSRFSEEFSFQTLAPGACYTTPKVRSLDPFELTERSDAAAVLPSTGGCCGPQSQSCM